MIHIDTLLQANNWRASTFLLIGKGPSYSRLKNIETSSYVNVALNHAVRDIKVDIAHIIDFDVVEECSAEIRNNARYLLMPIKPHYKGTHANLSLPKLVMENELLRDFDKTGRLIWYNLRASRLQLSTWLLAFRGYQTVNTGKFNADTLTELLARFGINTIRTIGIDGGKSYDSSFADLEEKTLFINQQTSFEPQFQRIRGHIEKYNLSFRSLEEDLPIKIFVGTTDAQGLASRVLEYSIKTTTQSPVEFCGLDQANREYRSPHANVNKEKTPFSFQRFLIPELCNYKGKAIYLDSDMLVLRDIHDLWSTPMGEHDLLACNPNPSTDRKPHYSVMLLDCNQLDWCIDGIIDDLDRNKLSYDMLLNKMVIAKNPALEISWHWNSLENYIEGKTALLHFTDMQSQPWIDGDNPLGYLWVQQLIAALQAGFISHTLVLQHIDNRWVRPSLAYQCEHCITDYALLPKAIKALDRDFAPPYKELTNTFVTPADTPINRLRFNVKRQLQRLMGLHR